MQERDFVIDAVFRNTAKIDKSCVVVVVATTMKAAATEKDEGAAIAAADGGGNRCPLLSEYEKARAQNIERNNARLRSLGLISKREEEESNAAAWKKEITKVKPKKKRHHHKNNHDRDDKENYFCAVSDDEENNNEGNNKKKKRKKSSNSGFATANKSSPGGRKSLRVQGLEPDGGAKIILAVDEEPIEETRRKRVRECREVRQRAALRLSEVVGAKQAAKENPTASYEHSLMRVRTMTPKALRNRVKAIERAAGRHCVIKMAIFKSCLQDEGEWELSLAAASALERLKALQPPPQPSEDE